MNPGLSRARIVLIVGLVGTAIVVGLAAFRVEFAITPQRVPVATIDFQSMRLPVREIEFAAADGLELKGWLVRGRAGYPAIVLCHDWGATKEKLLNLAITLHERGFPLVLFDFRGHGASEGRRSTLGLAEKRDILGALDYARRIDGVDGGRVGLYGVGMGAHAAVLAASERQTVRVLVLDGLYPDAEFLLLRRFYGRGKAGSLRPDFLPIWLFSMITGSSPHEQRAEELLERLTGRDLLFVASESDSVLAGEIERMYGTVPLQPDVDGNLVVLPAIQGEALYGEQMSIHHREVADFFSSRLRVPVRRQEG
jgi:pimeloyl-ACP methyl ester carboxylesterase